MRKAPTLTSGTHTIQSSGKNRSFILSIPDNYDNTRQYRLVFGFHWLGGTAEQVAGGGSDGDVYAHYGLRRLANNSAIFVAPQGINNGWGNSGGEDVTFVDDMIRRIDNDLCVDTTQRFSLGLQLRRRHELRARVCPADGLPRGRRHTPRPARSAGAAAAPSPSRTWASTASATTSAPAGGCGTGSSGTTAALPRTRPSPRAGSRTHITTAYSGCRAGYPVVWAAVRRRPPAGPRGRVRRL